MSEQDPILDSSIAQSSPNNDEDVMGDYYQLKRQLLVITSAITVVAFGSTWLTYSLDIALSYLIGACVGVVYLGLLAREVERLGSQKQRVGSSRLALFIGLIVLATQWQQLHIVPIFLGFITYKAAIIFYVIQTTFTPAEATES
ncbi:MAG: ATP synthase subunit I [Spirulinaceae cyanobacterium]